MSEHMLGFVGLGRMGGPMSGRLVEAGHPLVGFDAAGTAERLPGGAGAASSVEDVARRADTIFLSVPDGNVSLLVGGQIARAPERRARTVVDLSTIGIDAARRCDGLLREAGVTYVDAPVSGGVAGARSGSLAMMLGTDAATFERLRPLLEIIARNVFRVGDRPGLGQAMKLLNNYVSAAALAATCEATVFGARLGLDLAQMVEVINASSGRSTASTDKFPRSVVPRSYDYGFTGALMTKDVALYQQNAAAAAVPHDLADAVAALWTRFNAARPGEDFTALHHYLEAQASE